MTARGVPRVVVVDEALPYPPDSGKRIRTWELLRRLAGEFEIALVHPAEGASTESLAAVRAAGIEPVPVPCPRVVKHGLRFAWDLLRNVPMRVPYMVMAHRPRSLRAAIAREIERRDTRLVHVEWTPLVANVPRACPVPVVISAHNVESDIWARYVATEKSFPRRRYMALQRRKVERFERAALAGASAVLAVSDRDADRIRTWAGARRVTVVRNAVDAAYFAPDPTVARDPDEVLFTGSLDWRPNQDAVEWFLADVLPLLRARRPKIRFTVVGRSPPAALSARWAAIPGVRVEGSVPDVRPYVARATVSVVPLRIGGGSRLKICEALAMGRPVVSTTIGAEGLEVGDGVVLADEPAALAAAVLDALAEPAAAERRAARGREQVLRHHEWGGLAPVQARAWREAIAGARADS